MGYGKNMNKFYRKPKPETMKKNREFYKEKNYCTWYCAKKG